MPSRASAAPAFLYVPTMGPPGSAVVLSEAESHYVARVCRARAGDLVTASDGRGQVGALRLAAIDRSVRATIERIEAVPRRRTVWMLCGEPEGQRDDWMVEKLAELGVARWTPIDTERTSWHSAAKRHDRWERLAVAALKQSRSAHLMQLDAPLALDLALGRLSPEGTRWLASEAGNPPEALTQGATVTALVGPAAGFTGEEAALAAEYGFQPVALSRARLRAETAAISVAAWWAAHP